MSDQLRSVRQIFEQREPYLIPDYQRGYKWTISEVLKLLQDIDGFNSTNNRYYCLQNITLVKSKYQDSTGHENDCFNVVDGQQRLTTLIVLLSFFKHQQLLEQDVIDAIQKKLIYKIRNVTQEFIYDEIFCGKIWDYLPKTWPLSEIQGENTKRINIFETQCQQWANSGAQNRNHQDIFHLFSAAAAISRWFSHNCENNNAQDKFCKKLLDNVKFIRNDVVDITETEIFSKVNGFRVPLSGADLLRAIFITYVARKQGFGTDIEGISLLNEARVRIGLELDQMNAWWSNTARKDYFDQWVTVRDGDNLFSSTNYPINNLYKLYAEAQGSEYISLDVFESLGDGTTTENRELKLISLYENIKKLHYVLVDWYNDREIYHYLGFLFMQIKDNSTPKHRFKDIWGWWNGTDLRKDFTNKLKRKIFDSIFLVKIEEKKQQLRWEPNFHQWMAWVDPEYKLPKANITDAEAEDDDGEVQDKHGTNRFNWYTADAKMKQFLILLDVIRHAQKNGNSLPLNMNVSYFIANKEDKEHVFPQTPIADFDLRERIYDDNHNVVNKKTDIIDKFSAYYQLITSLTTADNVEGKWRFIWEKIRLPEYSEVEFPFQELDEETYKLIARDEMLRQKVQQAFNCFILSYCEIDVNSLGNIVLLDQRINRSYGNDYYVQKRERILKEYNKTNRIRIHTRSVFAKEFARESSLQSSYDCWNKKTINENCRFIRETFKNFFQEFLNND